MFYIAYTQYQRRSEIKQLDLPIFGKNSWWFVVSALVNAVLGAMLLFGYYTQIAAILAVIVHLRGLWFNHRFPSVVILPDAAVILFIIICLSLLLSGAGAMAFDVRL